METHRAVEEAFFEHVGSYKISRGEPPLGGVAVFLSPTEASEGNKESAARNVYCYEATPFVIPLNPTEGGHLPDHFAQSFFRAVIEIRCARYRVGHHMVAGGGSGYF